MTGMLEGRTAIVYGGGGSIGAAVAGVVAARGGVDISINLVSRGDAQGTPLTAMSVEDLLRAPAVGLRANSLTARAAARVMSAQGRGVIRHSNSGSGPAARPGMGSTGPADAAVESFYRYLAAEVGAAGVRVCGIWPAGVAETLSDEKIATVSGPDGPTAQSAREMIASMSARRRTPALADVTATAVFLASDRAAGITGSTVNVTAGLVLA